MRKALFALVIIAALPLPALAEATTTPAGEKIVMTGAACKDQEILSIVDPNGGGYEQYKAAHVTINGVKYSACWRKVDGGKQVILRGGRTIVLI